MKDYTRYDTEDFMIDAITQMMEYMETSYSSRKNIQEQWAKILETSLNGILELQIESGNQRAQIAKLKKELEQKQQEIDDLKRENSKPLQTTAEDSLTIAELKKELQKKNDRIVVLNGIIQRMQKQ